VRQEFLKVLLPAHEIPDKAIVTKRTGEKEYVLRRSITVYREDGEKTTVTANDGTVFLVDPRTGDANAFGAGKVLGWHATRYQILDLLDPPEDK